MKRIQLFEFEDLAWFPSLWRDGMTRLIVAFHRLLGTPSEVGGLLKDLLQKTQQDSVVDLCSGSGGPMKEVYKSFQNDLDLKHVEWTLTDLYPPKRAVDEINAVGGRISYFSESVDATKVPQELDGVRTMICSFHHMTPNNAKKILASAVGDKKPLLIYEISDNSVPKFLPFLFWPINFLLAIFLTFFVRPVSISQLFFTFIVPVIPLGFTWDGLVSNARTYTQEDFDQLLSQIDCSGYRWEKKVLGSGAMKRLCFLGWPEREGR